MTTGPMSFDAFIDTVRSLFFELRGISDALLADIGCTAVERGVLHELEQGGPQTVPAMARARSVSRQAMQKTVDRLVERHWLTYADNPHHARSALVQLAPAGRHVFTNIRSREHELLLAVELPVNDAELRRAAKTLSALHAFFRTKDFQQHFTRKRAGHRPSSASGTRRVRGAHTRDRR